MPKPKLIASAAATVMLAFLPLAPAVAGGALLVPWAVGHVVGAAVTLATLPLAIAAAVTAPLQPPPGGPGGYYGSTNYYPPPTYYPPPGSYVPPGVIYGPQHYYPAPMYSGPPVYGGSQRFPPAHRGYSYPTMRYSRSDGRPVFSGSRGVANRRW